MGRGKKKGDKKGEEGTKEDVPSLTSLSISESQASTSASGSSQDNPNASTVTQPPEKAPEPAKPEEEEDDGLGLGLGGAKKKRPRKKKPAGAAPVDASQQQQPVSTPSGVKQGGIPTSQSFPPMHRGPGSPPDQNEPGFPALQSAPGFPPMQGAPGFPPMQGQGNGKGRGCGQTGAVPQPGYHSAGQPQGHPEPSFSPASSSQPTSQDLEPRSKPSRGDIYSGSSNTQLCVFKIPPKIIGNKVPCRKVNVLTNYLPMTIKPLKIHRYDVSFAPDKPKKMLPRAYTMSKQKHFPQSLVAFDQMKNCYALQPLPGVKDTRFVTKVEFQDSNGKTMNFEVSYKFTGIVDLGTILKYMTPEGTSLSPPTEAIQAVDVILRQGTLESYIKAGRQFFRRPARPIDLGDGLEMWTGLFQSAIFTSQPFINIDVAHKGFPRQQNMVDALVKDFQLSPDKLVNEQRGRGVDPFKNFLKNLRVMADIGGDSSQSGVKREFIVNDLAGPPSKVSFNWTDPKTKKVTPISVLNYFTKVKNIRLRYPNLNCLWVGPRDKNIHYPMEMLTISYGQVQNKQLNETQLSTMVKEAATPPHERKRKIEEVIKDMNYSNNAYFKKFGLEIKNEFFPVEARVLTAPRLDVGMQKTVDPRNGQWNADKVLAPTNIGKWGFVGLECDADRCNGDQFISLFKDVASRMGLTVTNPHLTRFNVKLHELTSLLFNCLEEEVKILIVVIPRHGKDYYHRVKQMAERDVGILTQCIKENTASRRWNIQTAKNVMLKINSKLMGVNQALSNASLPRCIAGGGVMIVGADVTHPSPEQTTVPSIAAVTASMDSKCYRYNIQLSIQTPKKEVIVEFEEMMLEHLQVFKRHNQSRLPRKIFVFRDGVSEGQFAQVMNSELVAVHRAYERLAGPGSPKPEVLFLLVQKRHHTRLFSGPTNPQNVEPGTVVDTHIVHARELDFYLVSHQAIKGTARPTRYHAVCNDGAIPHDEVEQLTYYLCHLYSRCMRSVSYPTPTYYAHLACLRARSLTYGERFDNGELEKRPVRLNVLDKMLLTSRMFFV